MVDVNSIYAGANYMNAKNVASEGLVNKWLQITEAVVEDVGKQETAKPKIVLSFMETKRRLALNATNAKIISQRFGNDTNGWIGLKISLLVIKKDFGGQLVDGIQVLVM